MTFDDIVRMYNESAADQIKITSDVENLKQRFKIARVYSFNLSHKARNSFTWSSATPRPQCLYVLIAEDAFGSFYKFVIRTDRSYNTSYPYFYVENNDSIIISHKDKMELILKNTVGSNWQVSADGAAVLDDSNIIYDTPDLVKRIKKIYDQNCEELNKTEVRCDDDYLKKYLESLFVVIDPNIIPNSVEYRELVVGSSDRSHTMHNSRCNYAITTSVELVKGIPRKKESKNVVRLAIKCTPDPLLQLSKEKEVTIDFADHFAKSSLMQTCTDLDRYLDKYMYNLRYTCLNQKYPEFILQNSSDAHKQFLFKTYTAAREEITEVRLHVRKSDLYGNDFEDPKRHSHRYDDVQLHADVSILDKVKPTTSSSAIYKAALMRMSLLRKDSPLFLMTNVDIESELGDIDPKTYLPVVLPKSVESYVMMVFGKEHNLKILYPWDIDYESPVISPATGRWNKKAPDAEKFRLIDKAIDLVSEAQTIYEQTGEVRDTQFLYLYDKSIIPAQIKEWLELTKLVKALA